MYVHKLTVGEKRVGEMGARHTERMMDWQPDGLITHVLPNMGHRYNLGTR